MSRIIVLCILSLLAVVQNFVYWQLLPERVAIHFGVDGQPNNWLDRDSATWLMLLVQVALPWFLVGVAYSIRSIPPALINIPHREYWLHPDRRATTVQHVTEMLGTIAIAESLLIAVANHLSFRANQLAQPLDMRVFGIVLAVFVIGVFAFVIQSVSRFWRVPRYGA